MTDHPDQQAGPEQPDSATPIDQAADEATKSMQALMIAHDVLDLLTYRTGFDLRRDDQYAALLAELGADAVLPPRDGVYYLAYVVTGDKKRRAVLLPEGQVCPFVIGFALARSLGTARQVEYMRGMLQP